MSEISREHEHLVQDTLADKIRRETDAAKIALLRESLVGKDATTVLPPKYKGWKSEYPVYLRKEAGSREDINGIKPNAQLRILDVAKETSDTKKGNGRSEPHIWYKVEVINPDDLNTKAYGNDNVGWVSAEFLHADTSHIDTASEDPKPGTGTGTKETDPKPGTGTGTKETDPKPGTGTGTKETDPKPGTGTGTKETDPKPGTGTGTKETDPKPGQENTENETGPTFIVRNGETVLPWLVGPDGKSADFTQIQKEFEEMVAKKTKEIQENPATKKANLVSDVADIWISEAKSKGAKVSDVEKKQSNFHNAINTLDGTPEKYKDLEKAISELFATMQNVEKNDKEVIDDEELTKIELIVNGINNGSDIDVKRREIFAEMRSGFFDVDGASSGVAEKLTRNIMDNPPNFEEFKWLKNVLNDPKFIVELNINDTSRIKNYLEQAGLRGGEDTIETIIDKMKKVSEQRGEMEKDVRTHLEKEIAGFDITNPTHKQYMDKVVEQSIGNQKKMIIEQEWMKFMIDTRPNFRNDPNINLLGGILGESAGWDMDIADENMGIMREIAITAALSAVPLGAGMAAARLTAVAGTRLVQATGIAARLANFANKGKWAARAVRTGEFLTATAVEGGAFHTAYGAAGNVEEWALSNIGINIDIVGDKYWEPKEWMKSMAMVAIFKGLNAGLSQLRGAEKVAFADIKAMQMGKLAKAGEMTKETIKRMVQPILKVPGMGVITEASAVMYVGEAFEQGLFPNFEEMTMAEFAQAVIMVLMGRAAGRIIQPRGETQKPEGSKGPKPEPTEPLRLENGEPVLKLMENSTHPDVLSTKLASLEQQYKTLKESGREGQRDRQELIQLNDEINAVKKQIAEQKPAAKEEPTTAPKEKFTTAEKAADHGKMRDLEGKIKDKTDEIEQAGNPGSENSNTTKQVELNDARNSLISELNALRGKYGLPDYARSPNWANNITLGEFSVGVERMAPKGKTEQPSEKTKTEKPVELTERQRLQKENAEANAEFDRLVNGKGTKADIEAARARKRATADALEKYLSSRGSAKPSEPEAPKTESTKPKLTPEQIRAGKELGEKVKKFTRGEGPYAKVLGDNGPNHMDIGGNMQITRHVEGGKFGIGRKETFSIEPKGSKTPGEKFKAEELISKLTPEQQSQLRKVMDSIANAEVHSRGNTSETSWVIDGVTHVKIFQTGFASDKIQTFEGTRSGDIYTGTLTRNDGRILEGSFKVQKTADRGHFDMVDA